MDLVEIDHIDGEAAEAVFDFFTDSNQRLVLCVPHL